MTAAAQAQWRHLLRAPWQWRRNDGSLWALRLYGALAAVVLVGPALSAAVWMSPRAAAATAGVCALLALTLAWSVQFGALLRLDHPHAAHAVPGHSQALRATAVGLWLALVALAGAVAALGGALVLGDGRHLGLLVAAGTGTLLATLALAMRWWWVWIPLCAGPSFLGVAPWRNLVFGSWGWLQQHWLAQPLLATLGLLALQALLLPGLFGQGDDRHARAYAGRERFRQITEASVAGQTPGLAAYGRWGEWLSLPWQRLANVWLAHVCRQATADQRSVMARADIVLYGTQHWVRQLSTGLLVQLVVALCLWLTVRLSGVHLLSLLEGGRVGISIGLATMALSAVTGLPGALWHSRREQALLLLLPGMPQGPALNRAIAWGRMRHCLWVWLMLLPALSAMVWAGHGLTMAAFVAIALPMSAWQWRDVARQGATTPVAGLAITGLAIGSGGFSWALLNARPDALLPWAAALLLLTAGLLVWRWRCLARWPQALPTGRLA